MNSCNRCGDLGILRLTTDHGQVNSLCFCVCEWSRLTCQIWKLPRLNRKIESSFEIAKCPLEWFLPDNERGTIPRGQMLASIGKISDRWRERLRDAEEFWKEYGPVFDDRPNFWNEPDESA